MQTFLPYGSDFEATARCLDRQRLLKQRVETLQIMNILSGRSNGWGSHPAVRMWSGYEGGLLLYQQEIVSEVARRGYQDTCLEKTMDSYSSMGGIGGPDLPPWIDDDRVTNTHKGRLYEKDPEHYKAFRPYSLSRTGYVCCDECLYFWPTHSHDYAEGLATLTI